MFHVNRLCPIFSLQKLNGLVEAALGWTVMSPNGLWLQPNEWILPPARTTCWCCSRRDGQLVCNQQSTRLRQLFDRFDMRCLFCWSKTRQPLSSLPLLFWWAWQSKLGTDFLNSRKDLGPKPAAPGCYGLGTNKWVQRRLKPQQDAVALDKNKR